MTPELKIEQRAIDALIPYVRNARTHSDEQVAQIVGSIKEFGWTNPILVDGENGIIAEPFGGSGSTLMGAETTGRCCYSMELKPCYVDVIVKRWQKYTGEVATLEADGRTFEEIEAERLN